MAKHQCYAIKPVSVFESNEGSWIKVYSIQPGETFSIGPGSYNPGRHYMFRTNHLLNIFYMDKRTGHLMTGYVEFDASSIQIVGTKLSTESLLRITGKPNTYVEMLKPNPQMRPIGYPEPFIGMITVLGDPVDVYRRPNRSTEKVTTVYAYDRFPYYGSEYDSANESWLYIFVDFHGSESGCYGWIPKQMVEIDY